LYQVVVNIQNISYSTQMHVFYAPGIAQLPILDMEESAHAIRVLRLHTGDMVYITDGKGGFYEAIITTPDPRGLTVELIKTLTESATRPYYLHVGIAPTKNIDRFEFFLEKSTEIGIDEITPILCRYSERDRLKYDRIERILIAAIKQSRKAYKPKVNEMVPVAGFVQAAQGTRFIAHCNAKPEAFIGKIIAPGEKITILIGPEGDFSEDELAFAIQSGFQSISLGNSILRTETAGIIVCSAVYQANALAG
jgi:16S rRNA (uracil1498-N3)-methyltransferase